MGAGDRGRRRSAGRDRAGRRRRLRPGALPDGSDRDRRRADGRRPPGRRRGDQVRSRRRQGGLDARAGRPAGGRGRRGAPGARPAGSPARLARRLARTTTSSASRRYSRNVLGPDGPSRCPTASPPCRPAGRCTPRRSATRCASPPATRACRSWSPRTGWPPMTTRPGSPTPEPRSRASPRASPTASTSAATCTGRCSTTSSGWPASRRPSGSSRSTTRPSTAR